MAKLTTQTYEVVNELDNRCVIERVDSIDAFESLVGVAKAQIIVGYVAMGLIGHLNMLGAALALRFRFVGFAWIDGVSVGSVKANSKLLFSRQTLS